MTRLIFIMSVLWLSCPSARSFLFDKPLQEVSGIIGGITKIIPKVVPGVHQLPNAVNAATSLVTNNVVGREVTEITDTVEKVGFNLTSSQCGNVKKLIGVNYENYKGNEPDMNNLELLFISPDVRIEYKLTTLTQLLRTPHFNPAKRLVIYMHGFGDDPNLFTFSAINNAFMRQGNYNILALDASSLTRFFYLRASTIVRFIGEAVGAAIARMMEAGMNPGQIHLVGHSLGAHIASFTGKTVYSRTGYRVARLTGLDPAGPCFANVDPALKLNRTDADFVDVIHSNGGAYGLDEQMGSIDFYPNGGLEQPNCLLQMCSHNRVWQFFAESVNNPDGYPAVRCDSWQDFKKGKCNYNDVRYMGFGSTPGGPIGKYFLQTAGQAPFALGMNGIKFTNTDGIVRNLRDQLNLWK